MRRSAFGCAMLALCLASVAGAVWARQDALSPNVARATRTVPAVRALTPTAAGDETTERALATPFIGVVTAGLSVLVSARVEGRVEEVHVRFGERVEAGAKLVSIDKSELQHRLAALVASQAVLRAEAERARVAGAEAALRAQRRRAAAALPVPGVSGEELASAEHRAQEAQLEVQVAQARIAEHQAQVSQLRDELFEADVRAPFSGTVATRLVDPGARVARGTPLLRIVSTDEPRVRFAVPPDIARLIEPGTSISVALDEAVDTLQATISHVAPEVEAASRLIIVEAVFETPSHAALRSNLVGCKARIRLTPRSLMRPQSAIGG